MKVKLKFIYTQDKPDYTVEEISKLAMARLKVFGAEGACGFLGNPGLRGYDPTDQRTNAEIEEDHRQAWIRNQKHNEELQRKLDSVYEIAGVPEKTLNQVAHEIEVELPDFPSDKHHIMPMVEMRGIGGQYDNQLLDRVNSFS
jgi:hypothetical protein